MPTPYNRKETAPAVPKPDYKIKYILRGHRTSIRAIKFSPNGKWLSTAADKYIYIWDAHNGTFIKEISGHTEDVNDIAWSPDSYLFVSASSDQCLILRSFPSGKCLETYEDDRKMFNSVSFDLLGNSIAAGTNEGEIYIWSHIKSQKFAGFFDQVIVHTSWVSSINFINYTSIISSSYDASCLQWDAAAHIFNEPFSEPPDDPPVTYAVVSPCQKYVLLSHLNQTYTSWEIRRNIYVNTYCHDDTRSYPVIGNFCYTGNRKLVVGGSFLNCVYIWDFHTAQILQILKQNDTVVAVVSHPIENTIASVGADNIICLWKSDV